MISQSHVYVYWVSWWCYIRKSHPFKDGNTCDDKIQGNISSDQQIQSKRSDLTCAINLEWTLST